MNNEEFDIICEHASTVIIIEDERDRLVRKAKPLVDEMWDRTMKESKNGTDKLSLMAYNTAFLTCFSRCLKLSPGMNDISRTVRIFAENLEMQLNEYKEEKVF